jgi:hypothetical protein
VELLYFRGEVVQSGVNLTWETVTELNNDFFTIERSENGQFFTPIGTVAGNGTVNHPISYSFRDARPLPGTSFYRLKQTDYDGTFTYSGIVTITFRGPSSVAVNIYPNPSNGKDLNIELTGFPAGEKIPVVMYDQAGRVHNRFELEGSANGGVINHQLNFNQPLSDGIYFLKIGDGQGIFSRLLIHKQ